MNLKDTCSILPCGIGICVLKWWVWWEQLRLWWAPVAPCTKGKGKGQTFHLCLMEDFLVKQSVCVNAINTSCTPPLGWWLSCILSISFVSFPFLFSGSDKDLYLKTHVFPFPGLNHIIGWFTFEHPGYGKMLKVAIVVWRFYLNGQIR